MNKLRYFASFFAITLALVWGIPSMGQVGKGSISGSVIDPQGAVVPGAQIKAKNVDTGIVSSTTTDGSGVFRLNSIPVGTYKVEVTAQGFKTATTNGVAVGVGQDSGMGSVHMSVGEMSTSIEVTADAPLIETTQAQISSTFSGTTLSSFAGIQENEGLDRLALFVPGVAATRSDNFSNTNGTGFSSNGLRGRNNDQEIDGQNNNDNSVGGPGLFLSNPEFVGQYVIVTNNFGPEYGRNAGSVVNIITKSGSNAWHGSVFGQENNSYLNALSNTQKNTAQPGSATPANPAGTPFSGPPRSNNEFSGGTVGGPILKNKAFLFAGLDNQIISGSSVFTSSALSPTPAGLATLAACPSISPVALSILQKFGPYAFTFGKPTPRNPTLVSVPTSTTPCAGVQEGGVTRVVNSPAHGFDLVTRSDFQLGNDSFSTRYLFNRNNNFNLSDNGAAGWVFNQPALSQAVLTSWTHNFSSRMVNEVRVGFDRLNVEFGGGPLNQFEPTSANIQNAFTNISFQTGNGLGIGPATNIPQARLVNTWQAQDNWNYVLGKHALKAGVNWTYQRSPNTFLPTLNGQFRFASLSQFLGGSSTLAADTPNRVQIANGNPVLDFREYDTFLYFGDDWKISQHLTLNLGLTWTYYGSPENLFNQLTTQRESNSATAFWLQSLPIAARTFPTVPSITNSFGPSVGFAYSPQWGGFITGHGKTTIRGGYRLLYDPPFYNIFLNESSSAPQTFLQTITTGLAAFPLPAVPTGPNVRALLSSALLKNTFDPRTLSETNTSPNFGPDKVHTWSFGFEREIGKNTAVEARYVGNHGTDLFQTVDGNPYVGTAAAPGQLQAGLLPAGTNSCAATVQSGPGAGTDLGRLACGFGALRTRNNGGYSNYEALQTEFRANNMFKQLTMRTGFTWSKTLDNVSEIFATGTAGNTLFAAQNPFNPGAGEYANSGLNIPFVWSILFNEQIPFFKEQHGIVGHVLGGWSVSADYLLGSGQGYTPEQGNAEALASSPFGNVYDTNWVAAFVGIDVARPFAGSSSAPANTVGAFAHDACISTAVACSAANKTALLALPTNTLVSINALNNGTISPVTNSQVRYIMNTASAQTIFGTPFGNVPRNPASDAISNIVNFSVYKNMRLGEHATFEMHATALNAFNHFNFGSVVPNLEFAGVGSFGADFANPKVTAANGRTLFVGGVVRF
jgi:hypothetical protein